MSNNLCVCHTTYFTTGLTNILDNLKYLLQDINLPVSVSYSTYCCECWHFIFQILFTICACYIS